MKTNKLTNSIKRAFLAFALTSLSFSSANALDVILHNGDATDGDNWVADNGTIQFKGSDASADFYNNSRLGNAAGGRFNVTSVDPSPQYNNIQLHGNSSLYVTGISATNLNIRVVENSYLYSDSTIALLGGSSVFISSGGMIESSLIADKLTVAEGGYWKSIGSSTITTGAAIIDGTVELVMTSGSDSIFVGSDSELDGDVFFKFSFTDDFIESIVSGAGYFDLSTFDSIVFADMTDFRYMGNVSIADINDTYAWTVTDLGGKNYRISNFSLVAIPEPSTYAAIFGVIALAFVAYRRRK